MPRNRAIPVVLALLLVVPPAVMAADTGGDGAGAGAAGPATVDGTPPVDDPSAATLLQGIYHSADVDPDDPAPLPRVQGDEPLVNALQDLADARGESVSDEEMDRVREDARDLPPDLRAALALVVAANAEATAETRDAAELGTLDRGTSAAGALQVARAVDAALPTLRKYSLYHASEANALQVEQARTVDAVVALATGSEPLEPADEADLPGAVLDLYDVLGVEAAGDDGQRLQAGAEALPDDVRQAAAVLVEGQARSAQLRTEAFADLEAEHLALLADPAAGAALADDPTSENLETSRAWLEAVGQVDQAQLAQAQLVAATAALQAHAVLADEAPEPEDDGGVLQSIWDAITGIVSEINPLGTAAAQVTERNCPRGSPLADCGNDVWFTDPLGIVVVSGPGTTVYDARYGQASLEDRTHVTLKRLPTDGLSVDSRDHTGGLTRTEVRGSAARELAENATGSPTVRNVDDAALRRPFYAASLDLGGDDLYAHHTAQTLPLDPILLAVEESNATVEELTFGVTNSVRALQDAGDTEVPLPDPQVVGQTLPLFASVLVDVAGDDRYDPGLTGDADRGIASASTAGQALLLDAAGDDAYVGGNHSVAAADTLGNAALLDLDGHDRYQADAFSAGAAHLAGTALLLDECADPPTDPCEAGDDEVATGPRSQGWGSLAGSGALVNRGGDDAYALDGAAGQGAGSLLGTGLFADVGGDDTGVRDGAGDPVEGVGDTPWTAQVVARPNDREIQGTIWAEDPASTGFGVAVDLDHPTALSLTPQRDGVLATFERASAPGVDLPGLFVVDGASDTVYDQDYALTVDLAGFDTYRNNAGGTIDLTTSEAAGAAGTALLLDLAGSDRYDARADDTIAWGVQAAARDGAGLLLDLGKGDDDYVAGDRAQAAAGPAGVALLVDDGNLEGADAFSAGDHAQAAARGGLAALVTLNGDSQYEAGSRAQGFGADGGVGVLADRQLDPRARHGDVDGLPTTGPRGEDAYRADELAQGAALDGGLGLLLDTGGNDTYHVADRGQGYSADATLAGQAARGLLVDLQGRETYEAEADPARAHGYADDAGDGRTRALLADFALPRVPLLSLDDATYNPFAGGRLDPAEVLSTTAIFPTWDPTEFYDTWLREGRGDSYVPDTTPSGEEKAENAHWEQPSERAMDVPPEDASAVGVGMDNPPIAAPKAGAERFFRASEMVKDVSNETVDLGGLVVEETEPEAELDVHPADGDSGCIPSQHLDRDTPTKALTCLEVHVEYESEGPFGFLSPAATADPDRSMHVEFQIRHEEADDPSWITIGSVGSDSYYQKVQDVYTSGAVGTDIGSQDLADLFRGDVPLAGELTGEAVARLFVDLDALCRETNGTGYCPDDPHATDLDARAWPDGNYTARAEVHTTTATLTAGAAAAEDTQAFSLANDPQLLGVDVRHPNPQAGEPGTFTLYTTDPHRGYEIDIESEAGPVATLADHRPDGRVGAPDNTSSPLDRTVHTVTARWPEPGAEIFPRTGDYTFEVRTNRFDRPFDTVHAVDLQTGDRTDLPASLGARIADGAAAFTTKAYLAGGHAEDGLRDDILLFKPATGGDPPVARDLDASLPTPLAGAAAVTVGTNGDDILLLGGRTPDGPTDEMILVRTEPRKDEPASVETLDATLPRPVTDAAAAYAADDTVYVFGGRTPDGLQDSVVEIANASSGPMEVRELDARLPSPRSEAGAAWQDGGAYVVGGAGEDVRLDEILRFEPGDDGEAPSVETLGATLPDRLADPAVAAPVPGQVHVYGGVTADGLSHAIHVLDVGDGDEVVPHPGDLPRFRQDTHVAVDSTAGTAYVLSAGAWYPSRSLDGTVSVDDAEPEAELALPDDRIGCPDPTCPGPHSNATVEVPVRAADEGSGVTHVDVALETDDGRTSTTLVPEDGPASSFTAAAERTVDHGDTLRVTATPHDGAGNVGSPAVASYEVDLLPPAAGTTLPQAPGEADGVTLQNTTTFPVGWEDAPGDAERIHLLYRIPGVHDDLQRGPTVPADGPDGAARLPLADLAPDHAADGTRLVVAVRAEDEAGNLQPLEDVETRPVELDLVAPDIQGLEVDPGFDRVDVSWTLDEPGPAHDLVLVGPDGERETHPLRDTTDEVTIVATGLDSGTTYDATVRSRDLALNPASATFNFTTQASLALEWEDPEPGAVLSGSQPVAFLLGAAEEARDDDTTWTLMARAGEDRVTVVSAVSVDVTGTLSDPEPPNVDPYPPVVDTTRIPDGRDVLLTLRADNEHGSTSAVRTVTVDNTPPTAPEGPSALLEGPRSPLESDVPWFQGPVNVTGVTTVDPVTGINVTRYGWSGDSLDRVLDPADPPTREAEGLHTFHHRSQDGAGNWQDQVRSATFGIDATEPNLTLQPHDDRDPRDRNVTVTALVEDPDPGSGALHVRAQAAGAEPGNWTNVTNGGATLTVLLPDVDGEHEVAVEARDRAGNVARGNVTVLLSTRAPALEGPPTVEAASPVSAAVNWTTDEPSITALEVEDDGVEVQAADAGFGTTHRAVVTGLEPDGNVTARVVLEDRAGVRNTSEPFTIATPPDEEPPTAPEDLEAADGRDGSVVLSWSAARDDAGVDRYVVERALAGDDGLEPVANVTATEYVDHDVEPGTAYRYSVSAVDLVGTRGPAAGDEATPTAPPLLLDPIYDAGQVNGTAVLLLEVTVRERGTAVEDVRAVADGHEVALEPVNETRGGVVYQGLVNGTAVDAADGVEVAFEVSDGRTEVRHPEEGTLEVPARAFGDLADGDEVPGPGVALLAAAVAAALALRTGRGPGGSTPETLYEQGRT